tara:strand:- start:923 stop:1756 length:834 start_codon:yes stop_codon:yes gene_type:complete
MDIIKNTDQLDKVLLFLKKGYSWNKSELQKYKSLILKTNPKNSFYGCYMTSNGSIIGAILLFNQGQTKINYTEKKIINMSCLYFLPEHRGPKVIKFLKDLKEHFSQHIITNYTATSLVAKILQLIGFKAQPVYRYKILSRNLTQRNKTSLVKTTNKINFVEVFPELNDFNTTFKSIFLYIRSKKLKIYFYNTYVKLLGINFKIPVIVWSDDMKFLKDNRQRIMISLIFKFKTIFTVMFVPDYNLNIKPIWYVFCNTDFEFPLLVSPIRSELEAYDIT